jgi:hypothetical protein
VLGQSEAFAAVVEKFKTDQEGTLEAVRYADLKMVHFIRDRSCIFFLGSKYSHLCSALPFGILAVGAP